jgi:hypothetical protein
LSLKSWILHVEISFKEVGKSVMPSNRKILADSHIAAVAISMLLFFSIQSGFLALWGPLYHAVTFLITAIAIRGVPYVSPGFDFEDRMMVIATSTYLFKALINFAAARLLSRSIYGVGPLRCLSQYRTKLARRNHVG